MARLRCASVQGFQTFLLGFISGIFFLIWLRKDEVALRSPSVSVVTTTSCPEVKQLELPPPRPVDSGKPCQCPVCSPCKPCETELKSKPARDTDSDAGTKDEVASSPSSVAVTPDYLTTNVDRSYYAPIIKELVNLGPPAASCFPDLEASNKPQLPRKTRKFDMVLVVAQGRSGSTSLLRLLNTLPCYNIRGENLFLFAKLIGHGKGGPLMADTFREALLKLKRDVVHPWNVTRYEEPKLPKKPSYFNRFDMERLDQIEKLAVFDTLQHVPGYITSGFKELRLFNLNAYHYNVSVNFLDQWMTLFPKTAVVFGYREKDIMNSAWWKEGDKAWTEKLLKQQLEWFRGFHAEIESGSRYGPNGAVVKSDAIESVMVEFDDLLSCNNAKGSGLRDMYEMLGEEFDADKCKNIMDHNVEDMGLAASEANWNGQQGFKNWFMGYRTLSEGKLAEFVMLNHTRPIPEYPNELEFFGPKEDGAQYIIRRNYLKPAIPDKQKDFAYVPCRQWRPDTESANVKLDVALHAIPGKCAKDAVLFVKIIKDGETILVDKQIDLIKDGEAQPSIEFSEITSLPKGTVLEMCVEPRVVVCEGLGVRMTINRHGPSRRKTKSD